MEYDSALNLQADVFKNIFGYQELPMAFGVGDGSDIPIFVEPITENAVEDYYQPNIIMGSEDGIDSVTMTTASGAQLPRYKQGGFVGKPVTKSVTHDISLGIGRSGGDSIGISAGQQHQLVVMYQDRQLKNHDIIEKIRSTANGEVRVEYVGRIRAYNAWHRTSTSPLRIGSSIAHPKVNAGTLGCFVESLDDNSLGVLSNNHILANLNKANIDDVIRHPGKVDGGVQDNQFATLENFIPIALSNGVNSVDCAWAKLQNQQSQIDRTGIHDSVGTTVSNMLSNAPVPPMPGQQVVKVGRTTGYTNGIIDVVNTNNLIVGYAGGVSARFDGQLVINSLSKLRFSEPGDSGSLILTDSFQPLGLLFGGALNGGYENSGRTYANPIQTVLSQLNLRIA